MTWTKLGAEFSDELAHHDLSDAAYRTHVEALNYLYRVESEDLRLRRSLVPRFAGSHRWEAAVTELLAAGFWTDEGSDLRVVHHADVVRQSLVAQQVTRERTRKAQQAKRDRDRARREAAVIDDVSDDVTDDVIAATDRQTDRHLRAAPDPWADVSVAVPGGARP